MGIRPQALIAQHLSPPMLPSLLAPPSLLDSGCATCRRVVLRLQELEQANQQLRDKADRAARLLKTALADLSAAQLHAQDQAQSQAHAPGQTPAPWPKACAAVAAVAAGMGATAEHLGARESQVLRLIAEGQRTPAIAARMGIAGATVEVHRRNIMRKLDLHSVVQLTKYALREGMTSL